MIYENDIIPIISSLKRSFQSDPYPRLKVRRLWLKELESLLTKNEAKFIDAINSDFGNRSMFETLSCEILPTISAIKHAYKNLPLWMKEEKRRTSPIFWFGKSSVLFQPIGLVAIISPWNYPLQLTLIPLVNALAAGNRVILKPSEKTKHFSALLRDIFTKDFDNSAAKVLTGDRKTSKIIVSNKDIDHIFFTGSTIVGKEIAKTAAINLTPVTLELGGKSPAYISKTANLTSALKSIVKGKIINAGQTCIAPDYLIVNSVHEKKFLEKFFFILEKLYPNILENDDYTSILSENNLLQLIGLLKDANKKGGKVLVGIKNSIEDLDFDEKKVDTFKATYTKGLKLLPSLILRPNFEMKVMQTEIFGPILPVFFVECDDEAISLINRNDRPLAFYWFGKEKYSREKWMKNIVVGGVTLNDCLLHCVQNDLPFGGVSKSGLGAYHGVWGFENFSHRKAIFTQSRFSAVSLLNPPYDTKKLKLFNFLKLLL